MVLLDDKIYKETKELKLGKREKNALLVDISNWLSTEYSVKALNFQFGPLPFSKSDMYRLMVIFEKTTDIARMYSEPFTPIPEYQRQIAAKFRELALLHEFADEQQLKNIFVAYIDFEQEAKAEANWKAAKEVKTQIKNRYPVVWDVLAIFESTVVFYYANTDIAKYENNGISKSIMEDYYAILKTYDELGYCSKDSIKIKFDSKENLDKNYEGSFFYYTR